MIYWELLCLCGGARKLARADFVVTFLSDPAMATPCDACGDRLDQGDEIEFCGRKKRLSEQEQGTFITILPCVHMQDMCRKLF